MLYSVYIYILIINATSYMLYIVIAITHHSVSTTLAMVAHLLALQALSAKELLGSNWFELLQLQLQWFKSHRFSSTVKFSLLCIRIWFPACTQVGYFLLLLAQGICSTFTWTITSQRPCTAVSLLINCHVSSRQVLCHFGWDWVVVVVFQDLRTEPILDDILARKLKTLVTFIIDWPSHAGVNRRKSWMGAVWRPKHNHSGGGFGVSSEPHWCAP